MDREFTDRLLDTVRPDPANGIGDPQAVLHAAYDAIIQGNFDALGELVADDVELSIHGSGPMDGSWRGRKEVVDATRRNFEMVAAQKPEVESMLVQGNSVAVLLRENGVFKSTGKGYHLRGVQWFTFADGKIKRIDEIAATTTTTTTAS